MTKVRLYIIVAMCFIFCRTKADNRVVDSLISIIPAFQEANQVDSVIIAYGRICNALGMSDPNRAVDYGKKAIELARKEGDYYAISVQLNNLGVIYADFLGEYDKAVELYIESMKLEEKYGDREGLVECLNNIGVVYFYQEYYDKALDYYLQSYEIEKELENPDGITQSLSNIGAAYYYMEKFDKAFEYAQMSLDQYIEQKNLRGILFSYNNLAVMHKHAGRLEEAEVFYKKGIEISKETNNKKGLISCYSNLGNMYTEMELYDKALSILLKSLVIVNEVNSLSLSEKTHLWLAELYGEIGNYKKAMMHYEIYTDIKDSILSLEKNNQILDMNTRYETEKKDSENNLLRKENKINDLRLERQQTDIAMHRIVIGAAGFGLLLLGALAYVLVKRNKEKHKVNLELANQRDAIADQKKEMVDSIEYAKRLQDAILPPRKLVYSYLKKSFILYVPKDIVAGDFYWFEPIEDSIYFAAADCTGHGVPGAMVSVICSNALDRSVKEFGLRKPGEILDKVRDLVIERFEKSEDAVKDGMDIAICALNLKTNQLKYAGANNSLWLIFDDARTHNVSFTPVVSPGSLVKQTKSIINFQTANGEATFMEIKADKQPVGYHYKKTHFRTHSLSLQSGDIIYVFTDGFVDQFGGEKGKKFKSGNLKKLLISNCNEPMLKQQEILHNAFNDWKGNMIQVDDVCIVGVRI